jgi:uncharacterized protein
MARIFINLPVADLEKSTAFFKSLDYEFESEMTDDNATCMVVDKNIFVMLLSREFFKTFTNKEIADANQTTEVILSLEVDSKEKVAPFVEKAVQAGATTPNDPQDHGFMFQWGFQDLDGHLWEVFWMDPNAQMIG